MLGVGLTGTAHAQTAAETLSGPSSTSTTLSRDAQDKDSVLAVDIQQGWARWKSRLQERTGLELGFDYNALGFTASSSLGARDAGGGVFRAFGKWALMSRDGPNTGSLVFKLEHRHAYGDVPLTDYGFELGYVGLVNSVLNDQGWRATNFYWQQTFASGRGVVSAGWLDVTDYVDVYALASPWTGFSNLAFQTGSGTIGGLPDGALGVVAAGFLTGNLYAAAGIVDANGDATDLAGGFDTLFDEGETFKSVELGWTSGPKSLFIDNAHVTLWQIDARSNAGTSDGHGIAFSYTRGIDNTWLPFLRGGWADGGGSLYEASLSAGVGYTRNPGRQLNGVGINWSRPSEETFGADLDDQLTLEAFSRWQLTEGVEITPSVQIIRNPALNRDKSTIALLGLRLRAAF
ncbi:MAG: carbohydrate porin [Sedimentitalea sp.]|nr:carbohydrate porin [Sedimentitalea sp.]